MSDTQPMSTNDRLLKEFLGESTPEMRGIWLDRQTPAIRAALLEHWAHSPDLKVSDVLALPEEHRHMGIMFLMGNPKLSIRGSNKSFMVAPAEPGVSVTVEAGTSGRRRLFTTIAEPTTMGCPQAINALLQFGPTAEIEQQRGKLKEMSSAEMGAYYAAQYAQETDKTSKKSARA